LTLLAFHAFLSQRVDTTILEVGVGGAFDSTNIVPAPLTTGVTSLGLDHTALLGNTLGEVAWNKAGIYKEGVKALSVEQKEEGMEVLRRRARELGTDGFQVVPVRKEVDELKLGRSPTLPLIRSSKAPMLIQFHSIISQVWQDTIKRPTPPSPSLSSPTFSPPLPSPPSSHTFPSSPLPVPFRQRSRKASNELDGRAGASSFGRVADVGGSMEGIRSRA
jgi:hypothetical protein